MSQTSDDFSRHRHRGTTEAVGDGPDQRDRNEPGYPSAIAKAVLNGLQNARVLDVGIGGGRSALPFQEAGADVLGVEADARAAERARSQGFEVEVARFEDWDPRGARFDAVIAGQAWHRIDPVAGAAKAAEVLRPGGRIAAFWNVGEPDRRLAAAFGDVYRAVDSGLPVAPWADARSTVAGYEPILVRTVEGIRETGAFSDPEPMRLDWEVTITKEAWLDRVAAMSGYGDIPPDRLGELLDGLGRVIDECGGSFTMYFAMLALIAERRADHGQLSEPTSEQSAVDSLLTSAPGDPSMVDALIEPLPDDARDTRTEQISTGAPDDAVHAEQPADVPEDDPFILVVDDDGVSRAPVVAFSLAEGLRDHGWLGSVAVRSVGVSAAPGSTIPESSLAALPQSGSAAAFGEQHLAARPTAELVRRAGLVMTAGTRERGTIVRLAPGCQMKTFTWIEARELAKALAAAGGAAPADLESLARALHGMRGRVPSLATPRELPPRGLFRSQRPPRPAPDVISAPTARRSTLRDREAAAEAAGGLGAELAAALIALERA